MIRLAAFMFIVIHCIACSPRSASHKEWFEDSTLHFVLHAQEGLRSTDHLKETANKLETIQKDLLALLHEPSYSPVINVYFVKDRETLTKFTGFPANGYTKTESNEIFFVDKEPFRLALRHELMHALSWNLWGKPSGYWLSEGIAVFASGSCGGYDLHVLAHDISRQNKLVSFDLLTDDFDFKSLEPSLQSASLVKYIYENYGTEVLKAIWQHGWKDLSKYSLTKQQLLAQWKNLIDEKRFETKVDYAIIHKQGCE